MARALQFLTRGQRLARLLGFLLSSLQRDAGRVGPVAAGLYLGYETGRTAAFSRRRALGITHPNVEAVDRGEPARRRLFDVRCAAGRCARSAEPSLRRLLLLEHAASVHDLRCRLRACRRGIEVALQAALTIQHILVHGARARDE